MEYVLLIVLSIHVRCWGSTEEVGVLDRWAR
jgi:hypothetical protein